MFVNLLVMIDFVVNYYMKRIYKLRSDIKWENF
jgi:hypothetical protein